MHKDNTHSHNIVPMAISAVSNSSNTPSATNIAPRQIRPKPIFWFSVRTMIQIGINHWVQPRVLLVWGPRVCEIYSRKFCAISWNVVGWTISAVMHALSVPIFPTTTRERRERRAFAFTDRHTFPNIL